MQINIKIIQNGNIPFKKNKSDAGYDLFSTEEYALKPGERKLFKTGIFLEIPDEFYGRIAPRSGLALKNGIDVLAGVLDSSYRGEVGVILLNTDKETEFKVEIGQRIAQLIIEKYYNIEFEIVDNLGKTERSDGGFGSTGC